MPYWVVELSAPVDGASVLSIEGPIDSRYLARSRAVERKHELHREDPGGSRCVGTGRSREGEPLGGLDGIELAL